MSSYVTLPSHANRQEFPNYQANWFKIRLPQPLRLMGELWQVGLSSISIPDTTVNLDALVPTGQPLFGMSCYRIGASNKTIFKSENMPLEALIHDASVVDGLSFMKATLKWFDKKFTERFTADYGFQSVDNGKNTCPLFKWENNELLLDNTKIARKQFSWAPVGTYYPHFGFNYKLALNMGWFTQKPNGEFVLGPNLLMLFPDGKVPAKTDYDWKTSQGDPLYYISETDKNNVKWIALSMRVSWKFFNLNVAFRSVVKEPTRSLHVYSDVGGSSVVGNRMTEFVT